MNIEILKNVVKFTIEKYSKSENKNMFELDRDAHASFDEYVKDRDADDRSSVDWDLLKQKAKVAKLEDEVMLLKV